MDKQQCMIEYINGRSSEIPGWFYPLDMTLIVVLDGLQKSFHVPGDICEVGVYKGKSLVLFGMVARDNETLYALDAYPEDYLEAAQQAMSLFCPWPMSVKFVKGDTSQYTTDQLRELFPSKVRFLHVDAGHEYHEVLHTLYLLAPHVHAEGIIIMDDYQDREFPGVAAAVLDFCRHTEPRQFGERPPQPALTALIASRVDTFQPVFKEATHGTTGRSAEGRGMAAAAAAVHDIRHNGVEVLRSSGRIGHRFPLLEAEARSAAA